jgi:CubicO group peptidase (beta-lactamase class C family)
VANLVQDAFNSLSAFTAFTALSALTAFGQQPTPSASATASVAQPQPSPSMTAAPPNLVSQDLDPFLDGLMATELTRHDIAGGVITVVKDGQVLLCKGYGFADYQRRQTVVADRTLFRPGSITKLFTGIAVMQLVEAGKLDLDRDINDYLDFKIPGTFVQPITMRHLLTHTAGFDLRLRNLFVSRREDLRPLRDYLIAEMPDRLFAPGSVLAYSNYGLALAGYIVERVSGIPFKEYVRYQILRPLQMNHTTFDQPLPEDLLPDMSNGYKAASTPPGGFEYIQAIPAGALSTTGTDMGNFMVALLSQGTLESAQLITPASLRQMEDRAVATDPKLNAMGLVFMESRATGPRIIGHAGDTVYFHSDLILIPETRVGFFVSLNSSGKDPTSNPQEIVQAFLDRYYPFASTDTPLIESQAKDGELVSGFYQSSVRSDTSFLRLLALANQVHVTADATGTLTIAPFKDGRGSLIRWQEIAPLIYRQVNGERYIGFRLGQNEEVSDLVPWVPVMIFQKVKLTNSRFFLFWLTGCSLGLVVLTALGFPFAAVVRWRYQRPLFEASLGARLLFFFTRVWCIIIAALAIAVALFLFKLTQNLSQVSSFQEQWLNVIHLLAWIGLGGGAVIMGIATLYFWVGSYGTLLNRFHTTLLLGATGILFWFGQTYQLLDGSLRF